MNLQYCKIGKVKSVLPVSIHLNKLEQRHSIVIEQAENLRRTDTSKSDVLFNKANKLMKYITNLRKVLTKDFDPTS